MIEQTLNDKAEARAVRQGKKIKRYRRSIRGFIFDMWKLVPQPPKPEYRDEFERLCKTSGKEWEEAKKTITGFWFGDPVDPSHTGGEWEWYDFQKGKHYTWQQNLILIGIEKAVAGQASHLLSTVSGHGIGKSATCSWFVLWFLYCFYQSQVAVTAPTSHQMHDVLWKEMSIWINKMPEEHGKLYDWTSEYVKMNYAPDSWFARARTSSKENTEAMAGVHSDEGVAVVADEASGIAQQVFDTAEGALTGQNVFIFLISNGTQPIGYFFETHHRDKADWQNFSFNGEQSPIVDRKFIALKAKHGIKSEEYKIRVKGGFPGTAGMDDSGYLQLIPAASIIVRLKGELDIPFLGRRILSVDPSGEGKDAATYVVRDRFKAALVFTRETTNDKEIAEDILTLADKYSILPEDIVVGAFGTGADVGKQVALATAAYKVPWDIYAVMEGNTPEAEEKYNPHRFKRAEDELIDPEGGKQRSQENKAPVYTDLYLNVRALMYFRARKWLFAGGNIVDVSVDNSDFKAEIVSQLYKRTLQGNRIQLMSKKERTKLRMKSPNISDAFAMGFMRDLDDNVRPLTEEEIEARARENAVSEDDRFNAI